MNRLLKLQLRQSELREKLGALLDADNPDAAAITETTGELRGLESQIQAAMLVEPEPAETRSETAEGRELDGIRQRSSLLDYVRETEGVPVSGASLEYRQALLGHDSPGYVPAELIFGLEQRVDAVSSASAIADNVRPIQSRVFAVSAVDYLGIETPTVPVGTVNFPRLSAGTSADVRSAGVELDGTAASIVNEPVTPVRLTASYTYGVESLVAIAGFEEALREDIAATLRDKRDFLAINGQAAVASTSPAVEGIISKLTNPTDPSDVFAWDDVLDAFDDAVDGKHAMDSESVRMLVNAGTYKAARKLQIATSGALLRELLPAGRFRVSANMPATASTIATVLTYAAGTPTRAMAMPTWAGVQLISDPYTKAKAGQRILTAIQMVGFQVIDTTPYKRLEFKIAT